MTRATLVGLAILLCGCGADSPQPDPAPPVAALPASQDAFWSSLQALCDRAFVGTVVESAPPDTSFADRPLVMHVRECSDDTIRIPFHVGENRSRTWVLTRTATGLRLKHDHRHEDGSEDALTQYGGDTPDAGTAERQEFAADSATAAMLPVAATNVWTVEVHPGATFVYALRRAGTERRFRAEFDLASPIPPPPPPWGS
jgi:hypothetical protein